MTSQPQIDTATKGARARSPECDILQQQAKDYARKYLANYLIEQGYTPTGFHTYTDEAGEPVYWKIRLKNHTSGEKTLRAFSRNDGRPVGRSKEPALGLFMPVEPSGKWEELYPAGRGKKPLYNLSGILSASIDQPVYIFEGEQKADFANGLGLVATTCGGAGSIATTNLEPLAGRRVIIWPDNDEAGEKACKKLIGLLSSTACQLSRVDITGLGLPPKGDVIDWAEQLKQAGVMPTAEAIQSLNVLPAEQQEADSDTEQERIQIHGADIPKGHLAEPMAYGGNGARFEIHYNGIFYISKDKNNDDVESYISSPVLVVAKTRDRDGWAWGRLLQWHDDEKRLHQWAMPMQLLQGDGSDVRRELADRGVWIGPDKKSRDLLTVYLGSYPVDRFALCVDRLGWHGQLYITPAKTYGPQKSELTVFQNTSTLTGRFGLHGDLHQWRNSVGVHCEPHSRLVFAISCAFAGQLLEPLGEQGGGFHIRGNSSSGKSTALKIAGSVWGHPEQVISEWRATSNALEGIAALHNDGFLGLDEINQCDPKDIGNTVYMLSNGQGKARMNRTGSNRPTTQWRILFLSAGEQSLSAIMGQVGKKANAGQEIRLADIAADAGSGMGIFEGLTISDHPSEQAEMLKQMALSSYGGAGTAWLGHITSNKDGVKEEAASLIDAFMVRFAKGLNGQAQRVARRFAIVAAAGEIATKALITGWRTGRAMQAAGKCFTDWLSGFGHKGNHEERAILSEVKAFFGAHGSSRFEPLNPPRNANGEEIQPRVMNRVGYYRQNGESKTYLVLPEQFKAEICKGRDPGQVAKVLKAHNWLDTNNGELRKSERLPDSEKPVRVYAFNSNMWEWEDDNGHTPENTRNIRNTRNNLELQGFQESVTDLTQSVTDVTKPVTANIARPASFGAVTGVTGVTESEKTTRNNEESFDSNAVTGVTGVTSEKHVSTRPTGKQTF